MKGKHESISFASLPSVGQPAVTLVINIHLNTTNKARVPKSGVLPDGPINENHDNSKNNIRQLCLQFQFMDNFST